MINQNLELENCTLGLPFDRSVYEEELREKAAEYCYNDVLATEAAFNNLQADSDAK